MTQNFAMSPPLAVPDTASKQPTKNNLHRCVRKQCLTDIARHVYLRQFICRGLDRADGRETRRLRAYLQALRGADRAFRLRPQMRALERRRAGLLLGQECRAAGAEN